ncbi:hypothetical protein LNV07_22155 [Paucibacter oligotrophus]|uniref:Uncharacterized protein n=1 Tax=Roseateles oligotrophus TaxID=1769250 RepID=A0ABT2YL74_9BURK|nr:hypothetical protein [Roseateles oligotrophus]
MELIVLKTFTIAALAAALLAMGYALIRIEKERYALAIGLCTLDPAGRNSVVPCEARFTSRSSWTGHLAAALLPES